MSIRHALPADVDTLADIEAASYPPAEGASRQSIAGRVAVYPDCFWLLDEGGEVKAFVNGFVTYRSPDLHIADSSCNSLAETVNTLLIVRCNDIKGRMGTGNHFIDLSNLFRGNFFCHK